MFSVTPKARLRLVRQPSSRLHLLLRPINIIDVLALNYGNSTTQSHLPLTSSTTNLHTKAGRKNDISNPRRKTKRPKEVRLHNYRTDLRPLRYLGRFRIIGSWHGHDSGWPIVVDCEWRRSFQVPLSKQRKAIANAVEQIIYRSRLNQITDLTTYVDVTVTDDSSFSLSLPLEKASDPDIAPGFTITVVGWGAKPKFTGILGPSVTSSSAQLWQGQYLIVDGAPLSSLLSPPVPISADVQAFLSLSPLTTTSGADVDKAKQWGIDILQDVSIPVSNFSTQFGLLILRCEPLDHAAYCIIRGTK